MHPGSLHFQTVSSHADGMCDASDYIPHFNKMLNYFNGRSEDLLPVKLTVSVVTYSFRKKYVCV